MILAGGQGTRLKPHTDEVPKPLLPVGGRPVIESILTRFHQCGIDRVDIAVHHMAEQIKAAIGNGERFGLSIRYVEEQTPLSTIGPLTLISDLPQTFFVVNGDILTDLDYRIVWERHQHSGARLTIVTSTRVHKMDYGVFDLDANGIMTGFREKPDIALTVSAGIYLIDTSILSLVPKQQRFGFDDLMFACLREKIPVHTYAHDGYWLDIGRPDDYEKAERDAATMGKLFGGK